MVFPEMPRNKSLIIQISSNPPLFSSSFKSGGNCPLFWLPSATIFPGVRQFHKGDTANALALVSSDFDCAGDNTALSIWAVGKIRVEILPNTDLIQPFPDFLPRDIKPAIASLQRALFVVFGGKWFFELTDNFARVLQRSS